MHTLQRAEPLQRSATTTKHECRSRNCCRPRWLGPTACYETLTAATDWPARRAASDEPWQDARVLRTRTEGATSRGLWHMMKGRKAVWLNVTYSLWHGERKGLKLSIWPKYHEWLLCNFSSFMWSAFASAWGRSTAEATVSSTCPAVTSAGRTTNSFAMLFDRSPSYTRPINLITTPAKGLSVLGPTKMIGWHSGNWLSVTLWNLLLQNRHWARQYG